MTGVLITRPREDAEPLAAELMARGHRVLVEPLLDIEFLPGPAPALAGLQGLLFTSANGVRALARLTAAPPLPAFTVGDATAAVAEEAGFVSVTSAGGDVGTLARLVISRCDPAAGPLLHVAASERAGDLSGLLAGAGFQVERQVLYRARPAASLSAAAAAALAEARLDAVLLFSPRTARTLATLIAAAGLQAACRRVTALCLSGAVADAVTGDGHAVLPWRAVRVAERPDQTALLATLETLEIGPVVSAGS